MSTLKHRLTVILFIATFSDYNTVFAETTHEDSHHAETSLDWSGLYQGFLPCDDCKGIKTTLALNKNNSYLLITQYVGKSDREIVEKGKFTWGDTNNTIVLTPRNSEQIRYYLVGENHLIQLDNKGYRITGDDANRYTLRRNEISEPKAPSSHH
ncbi:MAG: copper resistance protein NlpE [Methylococcales bacterium]|nr:copper resistance protein NlpE [Methylococcales bacterium]